MALMAAGVTFEEIKEETQALCGYMNTRRKYQLLRVVLIGGIAAHAAAELHMLRELAH